MSETEWESGHDDNSRGSKYDRTLKLREDIPGWTSELKMHGIEKFLFVIEFLPTL